MALKKVSIGKRGTKSSGEGVHTGEVLSPKSLRLQGRVFFITFRGISDSGEQLTKDLLAEHLKNGVPNDRTCRPKKYLVCRQTYESGEPHFHAILVYQRRKEITVPAHYDFMGVHPNIQTMRNMRAALDYVGKEDQSPLTNMDVTRERMVSRAGNTRSLYELLEEQMKKDPVRFRVYDYCAKHDLFKQIYKTNYAKAITLVNAARPAYARALLREKTGIKPITQSLIRQKLNAAQIQQYFSDQCYARVVKHINQIGEYPNKSVETQAPVKTKHLLISGEADIGKTSLVYHRANATDIYPGLAHYYPTYYLAVGEKYFPPYQSYDYSLVNWQQFTVVSDMFSKRDYPRLLNYLDGSVSSLPQKGRPPAERQDNPKHILTSNRTLAEHIRKTFTSPQAVAMSMNTLGARIDCVVVPGGKNIHFLRKLFVPLDS